MTSKRNKILSAIGFLLIQIPLLAAVLLKYFTKKKLGMMRHMVYLNGKWEQEFPIDTIRFIGIGLLIVLFFAGFLRYKKQKTGLRPFIFASGVTLMTIVFILLADTQWSRAYYAMAVCLVIYALLTNLWSFALRKNKT